MATSNQSQVKHQLSEFFKCKKDPIYFIENYVQLEAPGGNVLMKLYEPQKIFLMSLINDHHCIALKSRQIGISTLTQAYVTYVFTFYKNVVCGMVSIDGSESTSFCKTIISMLNNLPDFLRPKFVKDTEQTFILDSGCKFYASQVNSAKPGGLFRGRAITIAIVDEAAHILKIDEAYTGMAPALFKSQKVAALNNVPYGTIIISTPNRTAGIGKWYYTQWKSAFERNSIFKPHQIHWSQVKEFAEDPNWYRQQCEILGNVKWKIEQELEMKFVASSNSLFDSDVVLKLNDSEKDPSTEMNILSYTLRQYDTPQRDKFYLIGVDTASEAGPDFSTIQVVDYETFEQVAEFQDHLRVDQFCRIIDLVNKIYPNNMLIVESNSYGNQVIEFLTQTGTTYTLYHQKIKNGENKNGRVKYGLYTGPQTRPLMMDALYTYIKSDPSIVKGKRTILELIGLVQKSNDRIEADEGEHDDLCLALAFCAYVKMYDPPLGMASAYMNKNLIDQIVETIGSNFGEISYDADMYNLGNDYGDNKINTRDKINRVISKHIKNNLISMSNNSSIINTTDLLGFSVFTNIDKSKKSIF